MAKKKAGSKWNEVTPFSKFLAIILFVLLPLIFFWFGIHVQKAIDEVRFNAPEFQNEQVLPMPTQVPGQPNF